MERRDPDERRPCPECAPRYQTAAKKADRVMVVWRQPDGRERTYCHRCGAKGSGRTRGDYRPRPARDTAPVAKALWARACLAVGSPVEAYLRGGRGISLMPPPALRYLPGNRSNPHAMIAAFGIAEERSPGLYAPPVDVTAVHLTPLAPDARSRLGHKRMVGPVSGQPLMLLPPNDGLGIVLTEGIEDSLSLHQATGLGAWAGGSAGHMAKLGAAIPDFIECVTIAEDDNDAGRSASRRLASELKLRDMDVYVLRLGD